MKIASLQISNFKAITKLELTNIGDVVVVAGPNGCGKSCVLDAIRFLKSAYGGYTQPNEWHNYFGELQLDMKRPDDVERVFADRSRDIVISAEFIVSPTEIEYIEKNAARIIQQRLTEKRFGISGPSPFAMSAHKISATENNRILEDAKREADAILKELKKSKQVASVKLTTAPSIETSPNAALEFIFGIYDPTNIGIIDYHSATRSYQRERIGGINVSIQETSQRLAQSALYNLQSKYHNIKSELAAAYIRDILIEQAGGTSSITISIIATIKDLFKQFLPSKKFDGPVPGKQGDLRFPVKLDNGAEHDIDDLSSGEKELVYGYLRLRNVSPTNSIILLDEPELHLNPRLVLGLPSFYRKHLGIELNNQLWMTTHSDAFLRDAYKSGGFSIFHMSPADAILSDKNQAIEISADDGINRAMLDLVGDIAGFRPGNKIVIFESTENANFDAAMTRRLFPEFGEQINSLSGDNKSGVRKLYEVFDKALKKVQLPLKVYAIVDRDSDPEERPELTRVFHWDVYHIENYLLDEQFIQKVINDNPSYATPMIIDDIAAALKACAGESLKELIVHRMKAEINARLLVCLDLGFDPRIEPSTGFASAMDRITRRVIKVGTEDLDAAALKRMQNDLEEELNKSLEDDTWRSKFQGRVVLRRFAGRYLNGLPYEAFRDQIIARMGDAGHKPPGMRLVIDRITAD